MTGYDAQQYECLKGKALANGMRLQTAGDAFVLVGIQIKNYGHFKTLVEDFQFLRGYEAGKSECVPKEEP